MRTLYAYVLPCQILSPFVDKEVYQSASLEAVYIVWTDIVGIRQSGIRILASRYDQVSEQRFKHMLIGAS